MFNIKSSMSAHNAAEFTKRQKKRYDLETINIINKTIREVIKCSHQYECNVYDFSKSDEVINHFIDMGYDIEYDEFYKRYIISWQDK